MTQAEQISQAIATVERQISEAKSETAKKVLAKKLERLKEDLKKAKPSLTTLPKARKTVKALNKSAFQELVEELSKKPEYAFLKNYSQERFLRDKARIAKPKGYRFKGDNDNIPTADQVKKGLKNGTVYYEGRPIRSDISREIRLAHGGHVSNKGMKVLNIEGLESYMPKATAIYYNPKAKTFFFENHDGEIIKITNPETINDLQVYLKSTGVKFELGGGLSRMEFIELSKEKYKLTNVSRMKYLARFKDKQEAKRAKEQLNSLNDGFKYHLVQESDEFAIYKESDYDNFLRNIKNSSLNSDEKINVSSMKLEGSYENRNEAEKLYESLEGKNNRWYYLLSDSSRNTYYVYSEPKKSDKVLKEIMAHGGHVSKGKMVWNQMLKEDKLKFMEENFGYKITPEEIEAVYYKKYDFLPKNIKIVIDSKTANLEEYAKGGGVEKGYNNPEKSTHVLHIDGFNWYLEKIDSTHFYMSNDPNSRGMAHHVDQHRGEPYYEEVRSWLKSTKFGKGGNIQFRKLAKSNNFDIIVSEGRFEVELDSNNKVKSIVHPLGERHKASECPIYQKYKKEINSYLTERFAEGGNIDSSYLGTTRIGKGHYGWTAKTTTKKQINGYDWEITTMKRSSGDLVSSANGGKAEQKEGYSTFMYSPFEDPSFRLVSSKPKMVNEKAVTKQHEEALKIFIEKLNEMKGDKMATGGGIEAPKYFKNGGQTYTWLNVTKMKSLIRFNNKKEAQEAKKILNNLNDEFTYHLVEEGDKFVIYRDFSKDEFLLNIINSIGTDAEWVNVSSLKKEGSFESETEARKKFESLSENASKTYYLLTDGRKNTFYVYSDSNKSDKLVKEIMATGGSVGEKTYNIMHNVGKSKYVVNFHNGEKTYSDGSPFFDIEIFKNLKGLKTFTKKLESEGYKKQMKSGGALRLNEENYIMIYAKVLEYRTGLNSRTIEHFVYENHLNDDELLNILQGVETKKLSVNDLVSAVLLKKGNKKAKEIVSFAKSDKAFSKMATGGSLDKIKIGNDDFSFLLKLSDKELTQRLDLVRKQQYINGSQYMDARSKKEDTSKIEGAGERLAKQERAIIEARIRNNKMATGGKLESEYSYIPNKDISKVVLKSKQVIGKNRILDGAYVKGGKQIEKFTDKYKFPIGSVVWDKTNKRYGVVLNNYGDEVFGSHDEIRLDSDGNQNIHTYDKKWNNNGYNLVPYGSEDDKGDGDLTDNKWGAVRIIELYSKSKVNAENKKYYEDAYKDLLSGKIDGKPFKVNSEKVIGETSTGKSIYQKYTSMPDLSYEELKEASDIHKKFSKKAKTEEEKQTALRYSSEFMRMANEEKFAKGLGKFATGGNIDKDRLFNFLKDDLEKLKEAIKENDQEEIDKFFSYWNRHLKGLRSESNERMYNFLKDDLEELQEDIEENDQEDIDKFFSYWGQHLESVKYAKGGMMGKGGYVVNNFGGDRYDGGVGYNITKDGAVIHQGLLDGEDNIEFEGKSYDGLVSLAKALNTKIVFNEEDEYAKGGNIDDAVEELWRGYASAILFAETDYETEEPLDYNYSISDFDEETEKDSKNLLRKFYTENKKAIEESGLDLDTIGNDIWYTRAGHGAGFFDHSLDSDVEDALTNGAKALGEYPDVETYDGKISVRGGRVFEYKRGGKITKEDALQEAIAMGVDFDKDFHAQSFGNELTELAKKVGYRKAPSSSGSTGRAFFYHLQKIYDKKKFATGGNIRSDVEKYKKQLIAKAKSKGLYENFGQDEVRKLEDKYGYTSEVRAFDDWAMNFDLSNVKQYATGGSVSQYIDGMTEAEILKSTVVYDNGGETIDRYTVFAPDGSVYGMSENPTRAFNGFNQYIGDESEIEKGSHLGKRLKTVPKGIKSAVLDRMKEEFADGGMMYAGGGNTNYSYIEKDKIDRIVTNSGKEYGSNVILDGAYVTDRVRTPKMSRTQFEDETYSYGNGGVIRKMYVGDAVLYKDEVWYVTEKGGELGIVYSGSGAWGLNASFVPLSRIDMSQLTDMMGRKVEISKVTYHAKGGTVGDYFYDTRKDKAFQVIMEDGDKMAIQYLDRSKSPIGKAETISKNEFEYYVQIGAWNKWKQEFAERDSMYADSGKIYALAEKMTYKEYENKYARLTEKEKKDVEILIRLGDEPKLALATVLLKENNEDSETWNLYRYATGGEITSEEREQGLKKYPKLNF